MGEEGESCWGFLAGLPAAVRGGLEHIIVGTAWLAINLVLAVALVIGGVYAFLACTGVVKPIFPEQPREYVVIR